MSTQASPVDEFAAWIRRVTARQLKSTLSTEAGREAARRLHGAFVTACRQARKPADFLAVSEASVASAIAASASTGLYPGGATPAVYLVPQRARKGERPELQWRITHRGLCILASRAGFGIVAVPVGRDDVLEVSFGEVITHRADPAAWPQTIDELVGVIVCVKRLSDGRAIGRFWTPAGLIDQRRATARNDSVWKAWPIEMAVKTAIKFHNARGSIPMESAELRTALEADAETIDPPMLAAPPAPVARVAPKEIADRTIPIDPLENVTPVEQPVPADLDFGGLP